MKTQDGLTIFWNEGGGHIERPGAYCYGLSLGEAAPQALNPSIEAIWEKTDVLTRVSHIKFGGDFLTSITLCVIHWPDDGAWLTCLQETLRAMVQLENGLAWAGGEDCSPSRDVFDPDAGAGNVYAAYAEPLGFTCNSRLHEPLSYLSNEQLRLYAQYLPA